MDDELLKMVQTERRKLQNRESQRRYRENIGSRLEALELEAEVNRGQGPSSALSNVLSENMPLALNTNLTHFTSLPESDFNGPRTDAFNFDSNFFEATFPFGDFSVPLDFSNQDPQLSHLPSGIPVNEAQNQFWQPSAVFAPAATSRSDASNQIATNFPQTNSTSSSMSAAFMAGGKGVPSPTPPGET
ncbi:hypothetical protein DL98DRAFT_580360 [Cadophora sp. DSE1049]|nr:hypothetical protein DL98DRAFT_580360 [Cadophora sp. DSE1049]